MLKIFLDILKAILLWEPPKEADKPEPAPTPAPKPTPTPKPEPEKKIKLALMIGHNSVSQGAYSKFFGMTEYEFFNARINAFYKAAEGTSVEVKHFLRTKNPRGYRTEVMMAYKPVDEWDADLSMEQHFNAGPSSASGTETLHCEWCKASNGLGIFTQELMVKHSGLRDRGTKGRLKTDRGGYSLFAGVAPAVLTEFSFAATNKKDADALVKEWDAFAEDFVKTLDKKGLDYVFGLGTDPGEPNI